VTPRLSVIYTILDSHDVFRRQCRFWQAMSLSDAVEFVIMDDGSAVPLRDEVGVPNLRIIPTHDTRPWTWAVARNAGARHARGSLLLMADLDLIFPKAAIERCLTMTADALHFSREFGVLTEDGTLTQDTDTLVAYGLPRERIAQKGLYIPPHSNTFCIRAELFREMGGYVEDRIGRPYPQGEDSAFRRLRKQWHLKGKYRMEPDRPQIYMFPVGKFCGDLDYNPFGLFHNQSRKVPA
jgi:glycosyltransferase involved in cell wall biosynthesis